MYCSENSVAEDCSECLPNNLTTTLNSVTTRQVTEITYHFVILCDIMTLLILEQNNN